MVAFSSRSKNVEVCLPYKLQLQLYLKNSWQYRTKRTGPQIASANPGGTVTLEDYNENKYTKIYKGDLHNCLHRLYQQVKAFLKMAHAMFCQLSSTVFYVFLKVNEFNVFHYVPEKLSQWLTNTIHGCIKGLLRWIQYNMPLWSL